MNFNSTDNVPGRKGENLAKMIYESDSYYTSSSSVIGMNIIITLVRKTLQKQLLVQQIHIVVFTLLLIFFFILWNISVRECSLKLFKQKLNSIGSKSTEICWICTLLHYQCLHNRGLINWYLISITIHIFAFQFGV